MRENDTDPQTEVRHKYVRFQHTSSPYSRPISHYLQNHSHYIHALQKANHNNETFRTKVKSYLRETWVGET